MGGGQSGDQMVLVKRAVATVKSEGRRSSHESIDLTVRLSPSVLSASSVGSDPFPRLVCQQMTQIYADVGQTPSRAIASCLFGELDEEIDVFAGKQTDTGGDRHQDGQADLNAFVVGSE
jgi:hypothetical protein